MGSKKDFSHYFVQLHLLDKYLDKKVSEGEKLKTGLSINGKKNVSELDLRVEAVTKGMRRASLTPKEREKLKTMQREIYKKFG